MLLVQVFPASIICLLHFVNFILSKENPFETILERLDRIEKAISNLKTENSIVAESKPMNLKEVVAYMGTSTSAIYKLTSTAEIPHYKLGKKLFFKKEEIDEWIYANKVKTRQDIENEANEYIARKRNPFR